MSALRLCLAFAGVFLASAARADRPADPDKLLSQAAAAERSADYECALECYLRAYLAGRQTPAVRDKLHDAARRSSQTRRHRDPGFEQFVAAMEPADALNLYADVLRSLSTQYADRERCRPARLFALGLDELDRAVADPAFRRRHLPDAASADVAAFRAALLAMKLTPPATVRGCRQAVLDLLPDAQMRLALANPSAVVFEFLCGACGGLDEYTVYLTPDQARAELASPVFELAGYGLLVAVSGGALLVEGVVPDSYAALQLPIKPGDRIERVNGRPLTPASMPALADALRYPLGMLHELEVASAMSMGVTRVTLPTPVPTVLRAEFVGPRGDVGYVKLSAFRDTTPAELDQAILRLRERGTLRALVLDVRGNGGGSFAAGLAVAERFLPSGVIVTTQGQTPAFAGRVFSSAGGMGALDVPLVLLVDARTMSAAEILAAALKDHNRATLVGMPTFGKGAIQSPVKLAPVGDPPADAGQVVMTLGKAFAPSGQPIHGAGVLPHVAEADGGRQLAAAIDRAVMLAGR